MHIYDNYYVIDHRFITSDNRKYKIPKKLTFLINP